MNLVILSGKISNIKYGLVDRGKIYSIAFLDVIVKQILGGKENGKSKRIWNCKRIWKQQY